MKDIVIAGNFWFPSGTAPASRVRNYAMGFYECGARVRILSMAPMYGVKSGVWQYLTSDGGIQYRNLALGRLSSTKNQGNMKTFSKARQQLNWLWGLYGSEPATYSTLKGLIDQDRCDMFMGYGRNASLLLPLARLCRNNNVPTVLDITEISDQFSGVGGWMNPVYWDWRWGSAALPRAFDVLTVITTALKRKYQAVGHPQVLLVPSIEGWKEDGTKVTLQRIPQQSGPFHLLYVGALIARDAPELLLNSIRILFTRQIDVRLNILGRFERSEQGRKYAQICRQDPILKRTVNLIGEVSDEELRIAIQESDALILLRQNAPTEENSFPTRLIEYLKSGHPVVVSDVGDISLYLRDQNDALLVQPDDSKSIADAIELLVNNQQLAHRIGIQGRNRGSECFNRTFHAGNIIERVQRLSCIS